MMIPKFFRTLSGGLRSGVKGSQSPSSLISPALSMSSSPSERLAERSSIREGSGTLPTARIADSPARDSVDLEQATSDPASSVPNHTKSDEKQKPSISSDVERELSEAFSIFDADGNGKISAAELGTILKCMGENPSDEDLQQMIEAIDANGDGQVDFQEFMNVHNEKHWSKERRSEDLRAAFDLFDIDNNNFISAEELHRIFQRLGDEQLTIEQCSQMINRVDSDGDGQVNFEEFERMMSM